MPVSIHGAQTNLLTSSPSTCKEFIISKYIKDKEWLWILVPALIGFLIFMPGIAYPFYPEWDDGNFILFNQKLIPSWKNAGYWLTHDMQTLYTPLPMLSLMLDRLLFALNPIGYHLHSMLLHGIAAGVLYGIFRHLKFSCKWACIAAVLWAINPQRIESVVWITERKDVLAGVFSFSALLLYMRGYDQKRISWAAVIMTCLAMGSKPSSILLPGVMAAYILFKRRDFNIKAYLKQLWPYIVLVAIFYPLFSYLSAKGGFTPELDSWPRMPLVPIHNFFWYIVTTLIPFELNPLYPRVYWTPQTWYVLIAGILIVMALLCSLMRRIRREQWIYDILPLFVSWICLFMPIAGMFRFNNTDYCDRYNYISAAMILIMIMLYIKHWLPSLSTKGKQSIGLIVSLLAISYLVNDFTYLQHWQNSKALFKRALIAKHPNPKAWVALGEVGLNNNDAGALLTAGFGLIESSRQADRYLTDQNTSRATGAAFIGIAQGLDGKHKEAYKFLAPLVYGLATGQEKVYSKKMLLPRYWLSLTDCYLKLRQPQQAIKSLDAYLRIPWLKPADSFFAQGLQAYLTGDFEKALSSWRKASELQPGDKKIKHNLDRVEKILSKKAQKKL